MTAGLLAAIFVSTMPAPATNSDFFLDARLVRRSFDAASAGFDRHAAVHAEIRTRLLERLDIVRMTPASVLDLGAGTGQATRALKRRYRDAHVTALDLSPSMLLQAGNQSRFFRRFSRAAGDAQRLPFADATFDLIFSNLMLQWVGNPDAAITEARRVLRPEGLFTFTSLGPDSLKELRHAWAAVDDREHVHAFIDMHDLGDALVRAGFVEPVMDTERLTITYPDFPALAAELQGSGSTNVAYGRHHGLMGRAAFRRAQSALASLRRNNVLPVTLEIVYGHAWAGVQRKRGRAGGEIHVPLEKLTGRRPSIMK